MKKNYLSKIEKIINKDKANLSEKFSSLFLIDLEQLLNEYFVIKDNPKINVINTESGTNINVEFNICEIKKFYN